jgi:hypothetical protein
MKKTILLVLLLFSVILLYRIIEIKKVEYRTQNDIYIYAVNPPTFVENRVLASQTPQSPIDIVKENAGDVRWEDLWSLAYFESSWSKGRVGDSGCSFGPYQINLCIHKEITKDQAMCWEWSTKWTRDRLISFGYKKGYRTYSLGRHQGSWNNPIVRNRAYKVVSFAKTL